MRRAKSLLLPVHSVELLTATMGQALERPCGQIPQGSVTSVAMRWALFQACHPATCHGGDAAKTKDGMYRSAAGTSYPERSPSKQYEGWNQKSGSCCPCDLHGRSERTFFLRRTTCVCCNRCGLYLQIDKMVQLHQCREQRMGVILMGPSGSGKSTLWRTLAAAYTRLGRPPVVFTLNPKAMPRKQLLGYMDADTRCASLYMHVLLSD